MKVPNHIKKEIKEKKRIIDFLTKDKSCLISHNRAEDNWTCLIYDRKQKELADWNDTDLEEEKEVKCSSEELLIMLENL